MKNFIIIVALLIGLVGFVMNLSDPSPTANQVTLRSAPGNRTVQMFDSTSAQASVVTQFPNGTRCTNINGPLAVIVEGISMNFYKLNCNGVSGWVNAKWVK